MSDLTIRHDRPVTSNQEPKVVRSTPIPIGVPHPDPLIEKFLTMLYGDPQTRALKNTLARIADGQDQRTPYPTLIRYRTGGFDELDMKAELVRYDNPPRLYEPTIWNTGIEQSGEPEPYDPMYWDLKTNFLDPREVEAKLLEKYGEDGFEQIKSFMIDASKKTKNMKLKQQMKYPIESQEC